MRWLVVAVITGCSGGSSAPLPRQVPKDAPVARPLGPVPVESSVPRVEDLRRPPASNRPARPIDVILRSTPNGAEVAVDGVPLGPTPAYWNGMADGHEHEFTFVLPRHAVARYRFVPITSGVIHARLEPIGEDVDAGVAGAESLPGIPTIARPLPPPSIDAAAPVAPVPAAPAPDAAELGGGSGPQP